MTSKQELFLITTTPRNIVPKESFDEFKNWVLIDKLKTSVALRKYMEKFQCPEPDSSLIIELIRYTYPNIDTSEHNFTFKIHDSGYPVVQVDMNDAGFDQLVEEMQNLPPIDWS